MPQLALSYNSQSGNGLLGIGWSVSGFSSVSRTSTDLYHHGIVKPVDFNNDVYALDGSKLRETSPGNYETFVRSFSRITSSGTSGTGPDRFTVETQDAMVYEYGNSADSKFRVPGTGPSAGEVYTWAINKMRDRSGNYVEYQYFNDPATGENRITQIRYGGNSSVPTSPQCEVNFIYGTRGDVTFACIGGGTITSQYHLVQIDVKYAATTVHTYSVSYGTNNCIQSVAETGQSGSSLPVTEFVYGPGSAGFSVETTTLAFQANYVPKAVDFNGDGRSDITYNQTIDPTFLLAAGAPSTSVYPYYKLYRNDGAGTFTFQNQGYLPAVSSTGGYYSGHPQSGNMSVDFNGDGKEDVITISHNSTDYYINLSPANAAGDDLDASFVNLLTASSIYGASTGYSGTRVAVGDFVGNGKKQLMIFQPMGISSGMTRPFNVTLQGMDFTQVLTPFTFLGEIEDCFAMDHDGDGKDEVFITSKGFDLTYMVSPVVSCNAGGTPATTLMALSYHVPSALTPTEDDHVLHGDFNGDGKSDILFWVPLAPGTPGSGVWYIDYSNGNNGFDRQPGPSLADPAGVPATGGVIVADYNGDGRDDIFESRFVFSTYSYRVLYSNGNNSFTPEAYALSIGVADERYFSVGDFNGDGQADLFVAPTGVGVNGKIIYFWKNDDRYLLKKVKKNDNPVAGAGQEFTVTYASLPQSNHSFATHPVAYPFAEIYPGGVKVVQSLDNNKIVNPENYYYTGFVVHKTGLGCRGFERFGTWNMIGASLQQNDWWSFESVVPLEIDVSRNTTLSLATALPPNYSMTQFEYGEDIIAPHNIHVIYPKKEIKENYANNSRSEVEYTYLSGSNAKHDYGKPDYLTTDIGYGTEVTLQEITYSPGDPHLYNRDEPASITVTSMRTGQPNIVRTTDFTYNPAGLLDTKTEDPGGAHTHTASYVYDGFGNIQTETSTTGSGSVSNNYVATSDGRFVAQKTMPLGHVENFSYDAWGNVTSATDVNGLVSAAMFDDFARKVSSSSLGVTCSTTYHWANSLPDCPTTGSQRLAVENTTVGITGSSIDFFDYSGNVVRSVSTAFDGSKSYSDKEYDGTGRLLVKFSRPYFSTGTPTFTLRSHDGFDRLMSEISPICSLTHVYSLIGTTLAPLGGMVVTSTNTSASPVRSSAKTIDPAGRTTRIEDGGGGSVLTYDYNSVGQVLKTVANGLTTDYAYDAYGNLLTTAAPNNTVTCTYDDRDRVQTSTDGNGVTFSFTYDALNRVVSKTDAGSGTVFGYNYGTFTGAFGKLINENYSVGGSPVSATSYLYDPSARLISKTETVSGSSFTTSYTYDAYSRADETTFPSGDVIKNEYNSFGYHSGIWAVGYPMPPYYTNTPVWRKNAENDLGQTISTSMAPDMSVVWAIVYGMPPLALVPMLYNKTITYSANGFLITDDVSTTASGLTHDAYVFDEPTGDLMSHSNSMHTELFTYDNLDRMTSAMTLGGPAQNMIYLANGNIAQKSDVSGSDWSYDKYAVVGLPTPSVVPTFTQSATYTPFNKVATITEMMSPNRSIQFTYKPDEQRGMAKYYTGSSLQKTRYYAENYEKTVTAGTGAVREISYVMAEGKPVAMFVRNGGAPQLRYLFTNYQGSITHVMDETGGLIEERSYDPWGRPRHPTNWDYAFMPTYVYDRGYTAQEHLTDFNVINLNGRLYDPLIARMFSPDPYITDPANAQTYNSYSYCHNNPMKYTDKDGEYALVDDLTAAGIGGVGNLLSQAFSGNIHGWADVGGYFAAGAIAGVSTLYTGPVIGGATLSALNSVWSQAYQNNKFDFGRVDLGRVLGEGVFGAATSYGGELAGTLTGPVIDKLFANVASPVLRGGLTAATSNATFGFTSTAVFAWAGGASFEDGLRAGGNSALTSAGLGLVTGGVSGYKAAIEGNKNPWTGAITNKDQISRLDYAALVQQAQGEYPDKAGNIEYHHIDPKYMGGNPKGTTVPIDAAYHQKITNEFRTHHPYGKGKLNEIDRQIIMDKVYSKFPIPGYPR